MSEFTSTPSPSRIAPVGIPLLDAVEATAEAGWAPERLRSGYTGDCLRAYDSSDKSGSSQDIGFDGNGNLDTAALESFAGTGDAWMEPYDQLSGSLITSSDPPKIVSSGTTITNSDGTPAPDFTGSQQLQMGSAPSSDYSFIVKGETRERSGEGAARLSDLGNAQVIDHDNSGSLRYKITDGNIKPTINSIDALHELIITFGISSDGNFGVYRAGKTIVRPIDSDGDYGSSALLLGNRPDGTRQWDGTIEYAVCWQTELGYHDRRAIALNRGMI